MPREKLPEPPAPSTPPGSTPKFGSALLRSVEEVLRKNAFVAGVAISASDRSRWRVQIDVRSQHLYLKKHVLACAQEAIFDVLDEMQSLRARGSPTRCVIPETFFDLKVECPDSS